MTPLHVAARGGHKATVTYLVKKNADINITDMKGVSSMVVTNHRTEVLTQSRLCRSTQTSVYSQPVYRMMVYYGTVASLKIYPACKDEGNYRFTCHPTSPINTPQDDLWNQCCQLLVFYICEFCVQWFINLGLQLRLSPVHFNPVVTPDNYTNKSRLAPL